eukprot:144044_1
MAASNCSHLLHVFGVFVLFMVTINIASESCVFTWNNTNYDFSALSKNVLEGTEQSNSLAIFLLKICGNLPNNCTSGGGTQGPKGSVQLYKEGVGAGCDLELMNWDDESVQITPYNNYATNQTGISLLWVNGENCQRSKHYSSKLNFICDTSTKLGPVTGSNAGGNMCDYTFSIPTYYACPGFGPSGSSSSSLSFGWMVIIIFICALIGGFLTYYVILGVKNKNWV